MSVKSQCRSSRQDYFEMAPVCVDLIRPQLSMSTSGVDQLGCRFIIILVSEHSKFEFADTDAPAKLTGLVDYSAMLAFIDIISTSLPISFNLRRFGPYMQSRAHLTTY